MTSLRTITFDQFSSSFLNKIIDFFKENVIRLKLLTVVYTVCYKILRYTVLNLVLLNNQLFSI